ncbi:hypothetical protein KHA80_14380 [Anaerobacillus sp. HL2]|nr:hypothetical protein KHA80_14380 [Anaerobacillus sp. HL2]
MIMLLTDELRSTVEQIVKDFSLETNTKSHKALQAVAGFLPSKRATDVPDFPFVLVRPSKWTNQSNGANCYGEIGHRYLF